MPVLLSIATAAAIWSLMCFFAWRWAERRLARNPGDDHVEAATVFWAFAWVVCLVIAFVTVYSAVWIGLLAAAEK